MEMNMRNRLLIAFCVCSPILCTDATAQSTQEPNPNVNVYYEEDGIKPPALAHTDLSSIVSNDCKYNGAGVIRLSLVISSRGGSENVAPLYPVNGALDNLATAIARADHFVPGTKDGVAVSVAQELEIKLTLCTIKVVDSDGKSSDRLRLKSLPVQTLSRAPKKPLPSLPPPIPMTPENMNRLEKMKMNKEVSPPVPLTTPAAEYPPDQASVEGECLISLIVDANGFPQAMRVAHGINEELDEKALEAVAKYRFAPAKKNKEAIPVRMSIVVNFRNH
jgi:TonB family protein